MKESCCEKQQRVSSSATGSACLAQSSTVSAWSSNQGIGYRKKDDDRHKDMHSLRGVFVKQEQDERLDANVVIYPFKLIFPMNKARAYYCKSAKERDQWILALKKATGQT